MKAALAGQPLAMMQQPPNIVSERIDVKTGLVAPANDKNVMFEVFDKNALPLQATSQASDASSAAAPDVYHGSDGVTDSNIF
jgi:membrane carboxypeptidase/penicillin-binding protein